MVKDTFYNILKWIRMKIIFLIATFYFAKHLSKTLKNITPQKETKLKDKSKQVVTGSTEEIPGDTLEMVEEPENAQTKSFTMPADIDMEEVEKTLQKLLDQEWNQEVISAMSAPTYILSLNKEIEYFYSLNRKTYVPIRNNVEVIPVSDEAFGLEASNILKNFYAINNEIFDIDPKNVVCIGWN